MLFFMLLAALLATGLAKRPCNNSPLLCSKSYSQVIYLRTHDSPFAMRELASHYRQPILRYATTAGRWHPPAECKSPCRFEPGNGSAGASSLSHDVRPLRCWKTGGLAVQDQNVAGYELPRGTVVPVNPHGIGARELEGEYVKADLAHYGYVPPSINTPPPPSNETLRTWPTLNEMLDKDERLVIFINPLKPDKENASYLWNKFDFLWENAYEFTDPRAIQLHSRSTGEPIDTCDARLGPAVHDESSIILATGVWYSGPGYQQRQRNELVGWGWRAGDTHGSTRQRGDEAPELCVGGLLQCWAGN